MEFQHNKKKIISPIRQIHSMLLFRSHSHKCITAMVYWFPLDLIDKVLLWSHPNKETILVTSSYHFFIKKKRRKKEGDKSNQLHYNNYYFLIQSTTLLFRYLGRDT